MKGVARCIEAPMGRHGLEGYCQGDNYPFEVVCIPGKAMYYRLYPAEDTHPGYYETCGPGVFKRYFKPKR